MSVPQTGVSGSWFLAQYFATGDPGWIVPVQSMARVESTFNKEAFASLGRCYPDQELISAVVGGCVDPKDCCIWQPRHEVPLQQGGADLAAHL